MDSKRRKETRGETMKTAVTRNNQACIKQNRKITKIIFGFWPVHTHFLSLFRLPSVHTLSLSLSLSLFSRAWTLSFSLSLLSLFRLYNVFLFRFSLVLYQSLSLLLFRLSPIRYLSLSLSLLILFVAHLYTQTHTHTLYLPFVSHLYTICLFLPTLA